MNDTKEFNKWWKENMPNPDWLNSEHSTGDSELQSKGST